MNSRHVTASFAGGYLEWVGSNRFVSVNLIRSWAHRGKIRRVGTDPNGYALYDLNQIIDYAHKRGLLDPKQQPCNSGSGQLCPR